MDSLDLPGEVRASLAALALLSEKEFSDLRTALAAAPFSIRRRNFTTSVASSVPTAEANTDTESIVSAIMFVSGYHKVQQDFERFLNDLAVEMQSPGPTGTTLQPAKAGELKGRLSAVLQLDSVQLRAKASDLIFEDAQVFQSSRIITDVRPVFGGTGGLEMRGAVIVHSLKVQFLNMTGSNEVYFSLDDDDLIELKRVIERALQKADVLRSHLRNSNLIDLNPGETSKHA